MPARLPDLAAIDAAIARGKWWMTLFDALADAGMKQVDALTAKRGQGPARVVQVFCRLARAVRLAIVAAMRLDEILRGLAELRRLAPEAAAGARARAGSDEAAAAREKARAKREARERQIRELAVDVIERETDGGDKTDVETPEPPERDPVVEALERRLAVDPAGVDFDDLSLRETVLRICADLKITPDWSRWEAGDWTMGEPPPSVRLDGHQEKSAGPPVSPTVRGLPGFTPRKTDTAITVALAAGPNLRAWPPPRRE